MIDSAIGHLTEQVNLHLKNQFVLRDDVAVASGLVETDGSSLLAIQDKVVLTLVNVERDTTLNQPASHTATVTNLNATLHQPLAFNLYTLVASNFQSSRYVEALKMLSSVVEFFHQRPIFDHATSPNLDPQIERLAMEVHNLSLEDLSDLWKIRGGNYVPSVMYRVRTLAIPE